MPTQETTSVRDATMARFRKTLNKEDGFLVGAAVGAGMTAQAAQAGGADFVVAISAGRMRVMGVPSASCMLPVHESNELTRSFAATEILSQSRCPVFVGVSVMNPDLKCEEHLRAVSNEGFHGVINWPSSNYYPPGFAQLLDSYGIGFNRELQMLSQAASLGLTTIAYARTPDQVVMAARAGIDLICMNVGWNTGGKMGVSSGLTLEELSLQVRTASQNVRRIGSDALLLLEGGPLETADQLGMVCQGSTVSGYIGGSTLERLPVEDSVTTRTIAFKNTTSNLTRASRQSSELHQWATQHGLVGSSQPFLLWVESMRRHAHERNAVFLNGETGTPIIEAARALHKAGSDSSTDFVALSASILTTGQLEHRLFDSGLATREHRGLADQSVGALLVEQIESVPMRLQAKLARYLREGKFTCPGSRQLVAGSARLIFSSVYSLNALSDAGKLHPELSQWLEGAQVKIPSLSDRSDDIEILFGRFVAQLLPESPLRLSPIALRRLTLAPWPQNDAQLRSIAEKLVTAGTSSVVSSSDLDNLLSSAVHGRVQTRMASERDLILEALWRNNFHRANTAKALGVSRKTLYNKMKQFQLTGMSEPALTGKDGQPG